MGTTKQTARKIKKPKTKNQTKASPVHLKMTRAIVGHQETSCVTMGHQNITKFSSVTFAKKKGTHSPIVPLSIRKRNSLNLDKEVMWF